jgi:hypothetical protein
MTARRHVADDMSRMQSFARKGKELRLRDTGEISADFTNDTQICLAVMRFQIFGQMMRGVALAASMTDDDDLAAESYGVRDPVVVRGFLRRALTHLPGLVLVLEMMKKVMRVMGPDRRLGCLVEGEGDFKHPGAVMIDDNEETGRGRKGMRRGLRR